MSIFLFYLSEPITHTHAHHVTLILLHINPTRSGQENQVVVAVLITNIYNNIFAQQFINYETFIFQMLVWILVSVSCIHMVTRMFDRNYIIQTQGNDCFISKLFLISPTENIFVVHNFKSYKLNFISTNRFLFLDVDGISTSVCTVAFSHWLNIVTIDAYFLSFYW